MKRHAPALARRLGRLVQQPLRRQRLAVEAAVVLATLKAAMTTLPYARWHHLVTAASSRPKGADPVVETSSEHADPLVARSAGHAGPLASAEIEDVVWAVDRVGRSLPRVFTCLPLALTARFMLRRRGADPALRIGVMRDPGGALTAHAWLEIDGKVILGAVPELGRFRRLEHWPRGARSARRTDRD